MKEILFLMVDCLLTLVGKEEWRHQRLAATRRLRPHPHPQLPARHCRGTETPVVQTHLSHLIRSMRTLRFLLVTRAGRRVRIGGHHVLRLSHNPATEALYAALDHRLAAWVIF